MRRIWMAAGLCMAMATPAFAFDQPPKDATTKSCGVGDLQDATLSFNAEGEIWLTDGPWVIAYVDLDEPLWPGNTKVICEGTTAHVTSQGQGTFVVTMVDLDFADFLPLSAPDAKSAPKAAVEGAVAAR